MPGLVGPTLNELPNWIKKLRGTCPVVTWCNFVKYIRGRINPLALESHVIELVNGLQVLGEVVYLAKTSDGDDDVIVFSPKWLSVEVLGRMLSYETIQSSSSSYSSCSGCFKREELSALFPDVEFGELKNILQRLEFCLETRDSDGQIVYYFPALDFSPPPPAPFDASSECDDLAGVASRRLWQGLRVSSAPERDILGGQIKVLYPRIAMALRSSFGHVSACPAAVVKVDQWATGVKVEVEGFVTVVYLSWGHIDVVTSGNPSVERAMFEFSDYCVRVICNKILQACPGISLQKYLISAEDLKRASKTDYSLDDSCNLRCYGAEEILESVLMCDTALHIELFKDQPSSLTPEKFSRTSEKLIDLIAFGSKDVFAKITFGTDIHISQLQIYARFILAQLFDMKESSRNLDENATSNKSLDKVGSWRELVEFLNIDGYKTNNLMDVEQKTEIMPISKTDEVLATWSYHKEATIGNLADGLAKIKRFDARKAILRLSPIFLILEPS